MERISHGGKKVELFVITPRLLIFGMNCQFPNSGNLGSLHRSPHRIS